MSALRAIALVVWAAFFFWLWLSGAADRYVGPRTAWVVPFGAFTLTVTAVLASLAAAQGAPRRLRTREAAGFLVLLAPMLALVAVPEPDLGALAVNQKSGPGGVPALGSAPPPRSPTGPLTVVDLQEASRSDAYALRRGVRDGRRVEVLGFVSRAADRPGGEFQLARFSIFCCAADAVPYVVRVRGRGAAPERDAWVRVRGTVRREAGGLVLVAEQVTPARPPANPYL